MSILDFFTLTSVVTNEVDNVLLVSFSKCLDQLFNCFIIWLLYNAVEQQSTFSRCSHVTAYFFNFVESQDLTWHELVEKTIIRLNGVLKLVCQALVDRVRYNCYKAEYARTRYLLHCYSRQLLQLMYSVKRVVKRELTEPKIDTSDSCRDICEVSMQRCNYYASLARSGACPLQYTDDASETRSKIYRYTSEVHVNWYIYYLLTFRMESVNFCQTKLTFINNVLFLFFAVSCLLYISNL